MFETTEELLIENFMDATHTPFTHEGLIRGSGDKVAHQVTLSTHEKGLLVAYAETKEKIGVGLRFILGKDIRVKHTDEFLLPNIVKVDYLMNDVHRFTAIIACNPIGNEKTEAIIRLSFNFGKLNSIIKLILPRLAKKVIAQDFEITKQQFDNQKIFNWQKDKPIDCDNVFNKMKKIRRVAIDRSESVRPSETSFKLYL